MKTLALFSLSLAVALGIPPFVPDEIQNNVLDEEKQSPLLKDLLPAQGHVVVDDPVSQVQPGSKEKPEKLAMVLVDMEQSQYIVEPAVNIKPEVGVEQEGDVKKEVEENKPEPQLKPEPDVEGEPEVKKEQEGKNNQEVKVEQEVKADPEGRPVLEVKLESTGPLDVEDNEANVQTEVNAEFKVNAKADIEMGNELTHDQGLQDESEDNVAVDDSVPQVQPDSKEQPEGLAMMPDLGKVETEDKKDPDANMEPEVKLNSEVKGEVDENVEPEGEMEPELDGYPDFKVESEVKVELGEVEKEAEMKTMFDEVQGKFQVQMSLEEEPETGPELNERHIEMEGKHEMIGEPIMELEPLDDDKFQVQMSLEEESETGPELNERHNEMEGKHEMIGEPIMELEPLDDDKFQVQMSLEEESETGQELNERNIEMEGKNEMIGELEPLDDDKFQVQMSLEEESETGQELNERNIEMEGKNEMIGEPVMELELIDDDYLFENELSKKALLSEKIREVSHIETNLELEPEMKPEEVVPDVAIMEEGAALDSVGQPMQSLEEYFPNEEARMGMEQASHIVAESDYLLMEEPRATGRSSCPGVVLKRKCYRFFREPKQATDAEFYCQRHFPGGHLASITSPNIHREVINLIIEQNGALTRTWVGGLRYLETGRFIWLDGSHWSYADWLHGEPNNTADKEDCIEVLALGNGKFNDFTCWEPQAFICSYPVQ